MSTLLKDLPDLAPGRPRRRRVGWVAAVVVLAIGAAGVAVVLTNAGRAQGPPPPVVLPAPTPTVQAVEREKATAFQQALPDEVIAFAVAGQQEDFVLLDAGAAEAYVLTYTDGELTVTLRASQWPAVEDAVATMTRLEAAAVPSAAALAGAAASPEAAGPADAAASDGAPEADDAAPPGSGGDDVPLDPGASIDVREEPVLVGGVEAGRVVISGSALEARAIWTNGATVLELRGPGAVIAALYDAFPM